MNQVFDVQSITVKTNEELLDIYRNKDKYQKEFYSLVSNELKSRNVDTTSIDIEMNEIVSEKVTVLSEGKPGSVFYMVICLLFALFGGVVGIVGGYIYAYSTNKGPDGEKYYVYDDSTRKYGKLILAVGVIVVIISMSMRSKWWQL